MADEELRKILGVDDPEPAPEAEPPKEEPKEDEDVKAKAEQLENLNKAIEQAQIKLRATRKAKKEAPLEEEELPRIDMEDPSARAWDKRIRESVTPTEQVLERAKDERRTYALRQFLRDKPALAKDEKRLDKMMTTYDRIKDSTELTTEGILLDLDRSYAAEYHEELMGNARHDREERVREDILFSDAGVTRGATPYQNEKTPAPRLSEDDRAILAKWGMSEKEWAEDKKKFG